MAVTMMCGWEGGAPSVDLGSTISGTASYDTGTVRTGARSFRSNPASGANGSMSIGGIFGETFNHVAVYVATMPSVDRLIMGGNLKLNTDGTIGYYLSAVLQGTSTTALVTGQWYWLGWRTKTGTSVSVLQIDGVDQGVIASPTGVASTTFGCTGSEASAIDIYYDDAIADDTDFLAPSKVDTALPISDNTVTGVTDGNGGTTNLWDCVNNTPPAGVASANEAANPTANIRYPASTTEDYIADLETYTTLGIGASDTVLAVMSIVRHGEDIATGTKNLQNVGALTNPTVGGSSVTAGGDGGAHGAETGLWVTTRGTLTTSPTVTLGTSPTIRTSRVSESRVACIDFMGMLVVWTPAAVSVPLQPHISPMPQLLPR